MGLMDLSFYLEESVYPLVRMVPYLFFRIVLNHIVKVAFKVVTFVMKQTMLYVLDVLKACHSLTKLAIQNVPSTM